MKFIVCLSVLTGFFWSVAFSQQGTTDQKVLVEFYATGLPPIEMTILLHNTEAYLPLREMFDALGIKGDFDATNLKLQGFFKDPDTSYVVDFQKGTASIRDRRFSVTSQDYIVDGGKLYLRTDFLNDLFGTDFKYFPRKVRVELRTTRGVPALLARARRRRFELLQERQLAISSPDFYLGREATVFGAGRFDWLTTTSFTPYRFLGTRFTLALGLQALGGDFTGNEVGFVDHGRNENDFRGRYRLPIFGNNLATQLTVGDFTSNGIQIRLVRGAELTNRPLAQRYSFSREVFHGQFDPLIDLDLVGTALNPLYQQTSDLGLYQFDVPIVYGQGLVEIHAYDPWGGIQTLRYRMNIPRNLVPPGQIEYAITGGKIRPPIDIYTSSNYVNWGVSSDLTLGMKLDYFDVRNVRDKFYPAIDASARITRSLIFNASVAPRAQSQASLSWLFSTAGTLEAVGTQYARNAFFNPTGLLNNVNVTASYPTMIGKIPLGFGVFMDQSNFDGFVTKEVQGSLSTFFQNFAPRISALYSWRANDDQGSVPTHHLYDVSVAAFLPAGVVFQPEISYEQLTDNVESIVATLSKSVGRDLRGFLTYGRFPQAGSYFIGLSISYYFPFARVQAGVTEVNGKNLQYSTSQAGSIGFDPRSGSLYYDNSPSFVGYGGIEVHPFYDANNNGVLDKGEEVIQKAHVYYSNLSRATPYVSLPINKLFLDRLPSYEDYGIFLDPQSLDNPVWIPRSPSFQLLSEPNYIRRVDMPVVTGGTVHGTIYIMQDSVKREAEQIKVVITPVSVADKAVKKYSKSTSTFSTGEFEFTPLPPGKYIVQLDASQLDNLGFSSEPNNREIELVARPDGDIINNVDFVLRPK